MAIRVPPKLFVLTIKNILTTFTLGIPKRAEKYFPTEN